MLTIASSPAALLLDGQLRYQLVVGEQARVLGWDALRGQPIAATPGLTAEQLRRYEDRCRRALAGEEQFVQGDYAGRCFAATISPVIGAIPGLTPATGILVVAHDITDAQRQERELAQQAQFDALTGLPNRTHFRAQLDAALAAAGPLSGCALMFLDLDNFKEVNDSLGHAAGDELLKVVAVRLREAVRADDVVARLSGDEFTVLLANADADAAQGVAARITEALKRPVRVHGQDLFPGVSIGIARMPKDGYTADKLLKAADTAMYAAKRGGRGTYRFFESRMAHRATTQMQLTSELHRALAREEFELHYQPQLSLPDQRVISVEALVRWNHPERGLLAPDLFIPATEQRGLIVGLGAWVLRRGCAQLAEWRAEGLDIPRVTVNVAVGQLQDPAFAATVRDALADGGLPPESLELEITETALMDPGRASAVLGELKALGVSIAIDDFGTGYSSLTRLRRLPIDFAGGWMWSRALPAAELAAWVRRLALV